MKGGGRDYAKPDYKNKYDCFLSSVLEVLGIEDSEVDFDLLRSTFKKVEYENLEFLGDAVANFCLSGIVRTQKAFEVLSSGECFEQLSKYIINKANKIEKDYDKNCEEYSPRHKKAGDNFEALTGALFLSGISLNRIKQMIFNLYKRLMIKGALYYNGAMFSCKMPNSDFKTELSREKFCKLITAIIAYDEYKDTINSVGQMSRYQSDLLERVTDDFIADICNQDF